VQQFNTELQEGSNNLQANAGAFKAGQYQVVIETGTTRVVQKLIKQ